MISPSIIRHGIAPLWAWHEGSPYLRVCEQLKQKERIDCSERLQQQWTKLTRLILHAWEEYAFYRTRLSEAGFEPGDLKDWKDLAALPLLTKRDIAQSDGSMIATGSDKARLVPRKTSGSTGVSVNFFVNDDEYQFKRGVQLYRDSWTGWSLGEWSALVWGNPTYQYSLRGRLRNRLLMRYFSLDTLKMDRVMMDEFARNILHRKPTLLFGHAHSLYLFANYWEEKGLPLYRFKGILSTAMVLHDHERRKCESVFHTPVFDRYGCEEVSLIASECEAHGGLHLNTDTLVVEILKDGRPARPGETGAVVVTDLHNFAMPFIRYQVGDMVVPAGGTCFCGRTYPLLAQVAGRIADYLRTPEGHWISGISLTENFATLIPGLHQVQIIQEEPDSLILRIVEGADFGEHSVVRIRELVEECFGPRMRYRVEPVERIDPEPSGKYRFSIYRVGTCQGT